MPNTPNMSLPVNTVGSTATSSPQWAQNVNSAFSLLDQHTHASGSGVQITPSGLSISSDLSFISNNATNVRAVRMSAQTVAIPATGLDLNEIYVSGVDLYYNDGNGNQVRLTSSGGVAGTPGSIGGLSSPASATYVAATPAFVFQSAASTPANLDGGALTLRNITASSNGITISPPNALAANYSLTLPAALPAASSYLLVDNSGNVTTSLVPSPNYVVSSSSGNFTTNTNPVLDVTNLTVTITSTGKPIELSVQPDGTANNSVFGVVSSSVETVFVYIFKDSTTYIYRAEMQFSPSGNSFVPVSTINCIDLAPTAGSHTYRVQVSTVGGNLCYFQYAVLVAYSPL